MEKEIRIYVVYPPNSWEGKEHPTKLTDEQFADEAEDTGTVYTLSGFQDAFNGEKRELIGKYFIRILNVSKLGTLASYH